MRTIVRTSLLLAALGASAVPAHADPLTDAYDACRPYESVHDVVEEECEWLSPEIDFHGTYSCEAVPLLVGTAKSGDDIVWAFHAGPMYGPYLASSTTYCSYGDIVAHESHTGQVGGMVAATAQGPLAETGQTCIWWSGTFLPGDPNGHVPGITYYTQKLCS